MLDILSLDVCVLENERDVESLNSYYVTKLEIQEKQAVIQSTRNHIDNNRFGYFPIAKHATEHFMITSEDHFYYIHMYYILIITPNTLFTIQVN